jgi:amino acid transporter
VASQLFLRKSTGLVREASALDATIFNAAFSAPVGVALAWGLFFTLSVFPGTDLVSVVLISAIICVPIVIMMALMASSMPRTGGDYVWVSRILSPPLATISNFGAALSALIGATFWARFFAVSALGPILVTLGTLFNIPTLSDWGNQFETNNLWIFLGGMVMIVFMGAILIAGLKTTFFVQNSFFIIASLGTFLAFVVLLIGSGHDFVSNFNALNGSFGGGTADQVIAAVGAAGSKADVFNLGATLPSVFAITTFLIWNWWSLYLSGELKSAGNRNRQVGIMLGSLAWDALFIVLGIVLLVNIAGYDFLVAVNSTNPAYAIPTQPWYHFLASLVYNAPILSILIVGSFLFWTIPGMTGNMFMPIRTLFAWAFDRLLPERLADVNERTHSPVWAIITGCVLVTIMLAWSVVATDFITWLSLGLLAGIPTIVLVGVAAIAFPSRRPDLYKASPANVRVFGIPVLYIVAPLSIAVAVFLTWDSLAYPALAMMGNSANAWWIPAFIGMVVVVGLAVYYVARFVRARQGVDISLIYRELPPE